MTKEIPLDVKEYKDLCDNSNDLMQSVTPDGRFRYVNDTWRQVLGYSHREVAAMTIWDIIHPDELEHCQELFMKVLSGEDVALVTTAFVTGDGRNIFVEGNINCRFADGKPVYTRAIFRDVTRRRQAEEEIGKFKTISDNAGYGAAIASFEGEFLYLNEAYARMHGYTIDELISKHYSILYTEKSLQDLERFRVKLLQKGAFFAEELWRKRKDNTIFPSLTTAGIVKDDKGNPWYTAATAIDITKRKQAEEALRESEERYRVLLELSGEVGEAVVMLQDTEDKKAVHTFATEEWSHITGYSMEELLGMSWFELLHPDYHEEALERYQRRLGGEVIPGLFEVSIVRKDGTEVPIQNMTGQTTYRGKFTLVIYARDITGPKKAEQEREKLIQELRETLQKVKTLSGLLPICAWCKKLRDDEGYWKSVEEYLGEYTRAEFTHGICPECAAELSDRG